MNILLEFLKTYGFYLEESLPSLDSELEILGNELGNRLIELGLISFLTSQTPNWLILILNLFLIIVYKYHNSILHFVITNIYLLIDIFVYFILIGQLIAILYYSIYYILIQLSFTNDFIISQNINRNIKILMLSLTNKSTEDKLKLKKFCIINIFLYLKIFILTLVSHSLGVFYHF